MQVHWKKHKNAPREQVTDPDLLQRAKSSLAHEYAMANIVLSMAVNTRNRKVKEGGCNITRYSFGSASRAQSGEKSYPSHAAL